MSDEKCFLCDASATVEMDFNTDVYYVKCACCGNYGIEEAMTFQIHSTGLLASESETSRLSGVTREQTEIHDGRNVTMILATTVQELLDRAPRSFDVTTKVKKLLTSISRKSKHAGNFVAINPATDYSLSHAANSEEFIYLEKYAFSSGWLERDPSGLNIPSMGTVWGRALTPAGWEELARSSHTDSTKAFVAMWFNNEVNPAYNQTPLQADRRQSYCDMFSLITAAESTLSASGNPRRLARAR